MDGPVFIRLCRVPMPIITPPDEKFEFGKIKTLTPGNDVAVMACGSLVYEALVAQERLAQEGINARIMNVHTIKPIDAETIKKAADECGCIVTAEEHQITGALGGAVAEVLARNKPVPVEMIGMQDKFGESGEPEELMVKYGLKAENIVQAVKSAIKRKK
jgi:transketolase